MSKGKQSTKPAPVIPFAPTLPPAGSAQAKFEQWAIDNGKNSLVCYGSGIADLDYMFFSDEKFDPKTVFPGCHYSFSGARAVLVIQGDEFFDISLNRPDVRDTYFTDRRDMLRNSPVPPRWVTDIHSLQERFSKSCAENPNLKRMSDDEILSMLHGYFVNLKFVYRKIPHGPLHARWLLIHSVEPTILQLSRQFDLRRGGKGKWKGRDTEKNFTPEQYQMLSLNAPLNSFEIAKELFASVEMVKYWCGELKIPVPDFLKNVTW
jgi:hypothetical protein